MEIWVSGNVLTPSDARVKDVIRPSDTAAMLRRIESIKLVDYKWKVNWAQQMHKDPSREVHGGMRRSL
jgi:hypothetical protein